MKLKYENTHTDKGFTLIEVLVSVVLLGIAVTIVLQLFSANVRALATSEDYIYASAKAEAKMREVLENDEISEISFSEITDDDYRIDVSIAEVLHERTENLQVRLLEVVLTVSWTQGAHEKSLTVRTMKVLEKEI
jgi:prepilin-type N-terminal cleavage/methylation domain-containing protein